MNLWAIIEKFVLKRKRDSFPVTILSKRLYIFPNGFGLLFLFILLVMLAGSVNYHNNLGYMMSFLLGGIYLMSFHLTHGNLKGLKISDVEIKPAFSGDDIVVTVSIFNSGIVRNNIVFEVGDFGGYNIQYLDKGFSVHSIRFKTHKRGLIKIERIGISSDYPIGLARTWAPVIPDNLEAVVYPRPVITHASPFVAIDFGEGASGDSGISARGADDFSELKNYMPGDPVQRIDWKSLSKGHGLMTKYFEGVTSSKAYFIDWKLMSNDQVETKLGKMTHLVIDSEKKNRTYGLILPGKTIPPSKGYSHMHDCLKALAGYG